MNFMQEWFKNNQLALNTDKSNYILFTCTEGCNNLEEPTVTINGKNLERVKSTKFLGVLIDEHLSWNEEVDSLCGKLSKEIFAMRSLARVCDDSTLKMVYFSNFESKLRYGITCWGGSTISNMKMVFGVQKRAIRCLCRKERWERVGNHFQPVSCQPLFKELNILTAPALYIFETVLFFLKYGEGTTVGEVSAYNTRQASDFRKKKIRLKRSEREVSYAGANFFNKLPQEI